MDSFWHNSLLGLYNPEDRWMGLDFNSLFLDPLAAKLTHIHELTHSLLSRSTDYGLTTETILQLLPQIEDIKKKDKELIKKTLKRAQFFTQEGSACIMEVLRLRSEIGKQEALKWALNHFTPEYYSYASKLFFILETSEKYRNLFTEKIPHLAMHTGIRKSILEQDLLANPDKLIKYLSDENNQPDFRLNKMIDVIQSRPYLSTRPVQEICLAAEIDYFGDVTKQDAADFLNYVHKIAGIDTIVEPSQIIDQENIDYFTEANKNIIIGNMNFNLPNSAMVLWNTNDLLHYKDEIETLLITKMKGELEDRDFIEQLTGRTMESALLAILKSGEKLIFGSDAAHLSSLVSSVITKPTLIAKWGLYKPGDKELSEFVNSKKPDVVIYNTVSDMDNNFKSWFDEGNKAEYMYISASEGHPFQTLWIKDNYGILHLVNAFKRPVSDFLNKYSGSLVRGNHKDFVKESRHFNNAVSFWCGLPQTIDWYHSMADGTPHLRKLS